MRVIAGLLTSVILLVGCGGGGGVETSDSSGTSPGGAPIVTATPVTSVGLAGATLNGSVNPNGLPTECWFEYGTDSLLRTFDNTVRLPVGSGVAGKSVANVVSGLASDTICYYRICASNSLGTTRSPIINFMTLGCLGCHGGADGSQPAVNGAPVVTRYWQTSGHGKAGIGLPHRCEDCHDVGTPIESHAADGSGTFNTLDWPGKEGSTTNANTAHLKSFFFPVFPGSDIDYTLAFNNACGNREGCHAKAGGGRNAKIMNHAMDNVMEFGMKSTVSNPKIYQWYFQSSYPEDFYKSQSPWVIQDLTTNATGVSHYGTCVSCHDPHGTGTTDSVAGRYVNAMVRGNWKTDSGQFCAGVCH